MKLSTLLLLLCFTISCSKQDDKNKPSSMTCLINGEPWNSTTHVAERDDNTLTISGTQGNAEIIILELAKDFSSNGQGTYNLAEFSSNGKVLAQQTTNYSTKHEGGSGTVTITSVSGYEHSKILSGSFHFTAHTPSGQKIEITNGVMQNISLVE